MDVILPGRRLTSFLPVASEISLFGLGETRPCGILSACFDSSMVKQIMMCDGCREECKSYMHLRDVTFRMANKNFTEKYEVGYAIGSRDFTDELKDRIFCAPYCLENYLTTKITGQSSSDRYFFPGSQVGTDSPQGKVGK
jgi:hypothetical protein